MNHTNSQENMTAQPDITDERKVSTERTCGGECRYGDGTLRLARQVMLKEAAYNSRMADGFSGDGPEYAHTAERYKHYAELYSAAAASLDETLKQRTNLAGGTTPTTTPSP